MTTPETPVTRLAVLFVTHEDSTGHASLRYRSIHHAESLARLGVSCGVVRYGTVDLHPLVEEFECIVLHRVPWPEAAPILERARALGRLVVTDTDDLVFDPEVTPEIEAVAGLGDDERFSWAAGYRETIAAASGAIVATEPLVEHASALASPVEVVSNVVGDEMVALAERARERYFLPKRNRAEDETVVLGYLSGSPTHQRDFLEVAEAVLWALETYPHVVFRTVGAIDLDPRFDRFAERVERIPFRGWETLPEVLAQTDATLAPLDGNRFSACKSCVKYLEAALVEVPTVASAQSDFERVIDHGRTGFLARTQDDWVSAFRTLIEDPDLRREIGRQARADVHQRHTTRSRLPAIERSWRSLTRSHSRADRPLELEWLVGPRRRAGDLDEVHRLAGSVARSGHSVRVRDEVPSGVSSLVDIRIATDTETAYELADRHDTLLKVRLVRHLDEAGFELPLRHVCVGSAVTTQVEERTGRTAECLEPSVDPGSQLDRLLRRACFLRLTGNQGA